MARKRKPWRVARWTDEGIANTTDFTSQVNAYQYVTAELRKAKVGETGTTELRVQQHDPFADRWMAYEHLRPEEN